MRAITRPAAVIAATMLAASACGAADENGAQASGTDAAATNEMVLGSADAPVTVTEYASWTCPACLQFHEDVVGKMREDYIETGQVKFIFREFPTPPANISVAGFAIARCAGEDQYFDVVDELFSRQNAILSVARQGGQVKAALQEVASKYGITTEEEFDACLENADVRKAIAASVGAGDEDGVNATPTVLLDGEQLQGNDWRSWDGMQAVLDEALGVETPAAKDAAAEDTVPETPSGGMDAPDTGSMTPDVNIASDGEDDTADESGDAETPDTASGEAQPQ